MKTNRPAFCASVLAIGIVCSTAFASDHADPMSLNAFKPQDDPVANITDLHAFVVDKDGKPIFDQERMKDADQLIISLCVRRRLLPWQIEGIKNDVPKYSFRVHLDLNPDVRFFDPAKTRDGRDYQTALADAGKDIPAAVEARDAARKAFPPGTGAPSQREVIAQGKLEQWIAARGALVAQHQADESMQRLYGGILANPNAIAEEALLDFHLNFSADGENSEASIALPRIEGIPGEVNMVVEARRSLDGMRDVVAAKPWKPGAINVQGGVFDDPFIFPRFFRGNAIGIVTSIPLKLIRGPDGRPASDSAILLWATTHGPDGRQSDHVGRSLRTQLPRFGYLNGLHPSKHVAAITRVHEMPNLMENVLSTFLGPLEAHRHYDSAPDVMIYDLRRPAKFPNGRWLEDDVAKTLAEAGETLLLELSYAESRQFPRAETNDKPFRKDFPYLAPRWTTLETREHAVPGTTWDGGFNVPDAPDSAAIGLPNFVPSVWRSVWLGLALGVAVFGLLAFLAVRGILKKAGVLILVMAGLTMLIPIKVEQLKPMEKGSAQQPQKKLIRVLLGGGLIGALGLVALYAAGIRRGIGIAARERIMPLGEQGVVLEDRQYTGSTFHEVRDAVMAEPYYGSTWGESGQKPLPSYPTTFETVAQGLFSLSKRFLFKDAATRTIASHADLRWGGPGKMGVQRLVHPNGICLAGIWSISEETGYTGFFANGAKGLVIARYSSGLSARRGEARTLSMVGKLYPTTNPDQKDRTASFITQEDLGGSYTPSIHGALLRNAPSISPLRRGFGLGTLLLTVFAFFRVDLRATIRQLYEVAELGKPPGTATRCPKFMQLKIVSPQIGGDEDTADFRDEVLSQIYDRGDARKQRDLVFQIQVSDKGEVRGFLNKTLMDADWKPIGTITFDKAAASYNGDFVIHFHHPKWRADRNDPTSEHGPGKLGRVFNWITDKTNGFLGLFAKKN